MKFIISKSQLLDLIGNLQNVVAQKATIPILSNILIEAANDELVLTATDLTVGMRCYAEAKILEEGATTLPAKRFFQLIRELPDVNVEVKTGKDEITHISAGASRFKLHGMERSTFPALPDMGGAKRVSLPQKTLRELLYRTSFAASREENRYVLTGVLCRLSGGTLTFVGTDGKRLAKIDHPAGLDPSYQGSFVLPLKAVEEVARVADEKEEEGTITLLEDKVGFEVAHATLVTKLLAGDYPDVEQVIPSKSTFKVSLHREELISLLRQVVLFTSELNHSARFTFTEGELTLTANNAEVGEGRVSMPVNYTGERFEIAFNPTYFLDILKRSRDETVELALTDAYNPGVITDSASGLFVLMPMRLTEAAL
ncbi:MAG: DNA polymerase III subunit beta [Parachlamydiales bacterium]